MTRSIDLYALQLNCDEFVPNSLGKSELILDVARQLLVVTSGIRVRCTGDVRGETEASAVGEIRWWAKAVGP